MAFKEEYLNMKLEKYMSDEEIAAEMCIGLSKLYELKQHNEIELIMRPKKNSLGFTEDQLRRGESIGLSRRLMYKRYREYNWSHEKAVSEPRQIKKNRKRVIL